MVHVSLAVGAVVGRGLVFAFFAGHFDGWVVVGRGGAGCVGGWDILRSSRGGCGGRRCLLLMKMENMGGEAVYVS